ncbi:hypothetical protein M9458_035620, partial [Cirrhinus mrigala]
TVLLLERLEAAPWGGGLCHESGRCSADYPPPDVTLTFSLTLTVTLYPGLHLPSSTALIASNPVTNQAFYKDPGLSPC